MRVVPTTFVLTQTWKESRSQAANHRDEAQWGGVRDIASITCKSHNSYSGIKKTRSAQAKPSIKPERVEVDIIRVEESQAGC